MKKVTVEHTPTTFLVPAVDIMAIWNGVSNDEARYYLNGVFIEYDSIQKTFHAVSTDGHVMMISEIQSPSFMGQSCATQGDSNQSGFILSIDIMEKAFKAKTREALWMYGDTETGVMQFLDFSPETYMSNPSEEFYRVGVCEFSRIDGTFPDWRRVVPEKSDEGICEIAFNQSLLAKFKKASDVYNKKGEHRGEAIKFTFSGNGSHVGIKIASAPNFSGVLMPIRW